MLRSKPKDGWKSSTSKSRINPRRAALTLLFSDLVVIFALVQCIYFVELDSFLSVPDLFFWGTVFAFLLTFYISDLYRPNLYRSNFRIFTLVISSCLIVGTILTLFSYLIGAWKENPLFWRSILLPFLLCFIFWGISSRLVAAHLMRSKANKECYLLLGDKDSILHFERDFAGWNERGRLLILSDEIRIDSATCTMKFLNDPDDIFVLDDLDQILELPSRSQILSGIIVSSNIALSDKYCQRLMKLRFEGFPIYDLKNFYQMFWHKFPPKLLRENWFTFGEGFDLVSNRAAQKIKRLIDLLVSSLLLLILLPVILLTALAIKLDSRGPIFYTQWRTGLEGKPFRIFKFRSMVQDAEKQGIQWAKKRDPRITRVGYWLRLTRIDELPQLLNILRGEMSLIGPRPERPEFDADLEKQIPYYSLRYLIKPGITGWAQAIYPYGASVEDAYEKLSYDLYYIKNYSIWLDLFIMVKTIRVVLMGKGR